MASLDTRLLWVKAGALFELFPEDLRNVPHGAWLSRRLGDVITCIVTLPCYSEEASDNDCAAEGHQAQGICKTNLMVAKDNPQKTLIKLCTLDMYRTTSLIEALNILYHLEICNMHHYSIHLYIFHMYIYNKKLIDNELAIFGSSLCSIMRNKLPSNLHQFQKIFSSRKCFLKCKLHIVSHFECVPWDAGGSSDDGCSRAYCFDSLAPGKFDWNFRHVIFKQILVIVGWGISCEIALIWM